MSKYIPPRDVFKHLHPLAVIRQPRTAEAPYPSQSSLCGICGEKHGAETDFSRNNLFLPCRYLSSNFPHPHIFVYFRQILVLQNVLK